MASTSRRALLAGAGGFALGPVARGRADAGTIAAQADPLRSWNDGPAKRALLDFVAAATDAAGAGYVPPAARIAVLDQDGTLWVEHPLAPQSRFALDRLQALAPQHPEWTTQPPYAALLAGDASVIAALSESDWAQVLATIHAGMTVGAFHALVADWLAAATDPHFGRRYPELAYQPMREIVDLLRGNDFTPYLVAGGHQEFIRAYAKSVFDIPPEQVIGATFATEYGYAVDGAPIVTMQAKPQLAVVNGGKPEAINRVIGRRPVAAFGNATDDQQMLEWTAAGRRAHVALLAHHDDAAREYAYGPAGGLPDTRIGTFSNALLNAATQRGWTVVSIQRDWNRLFAWSAAPATT
jgi:hypothetical protein